MSPEPAPMQPGVGACLSLISDLSGERGNRRREVGRSFALSEVFSGQGAPTCSHLISPETLGISFILPIYSWEYWVWKLFWGILSVWTWCGPLIFPPIALIHVVPLMWFKPQPKVKGSVVLRLGLVVRVLPILLGELPWGAGLAIRLRTVTTLTTAVGQALF